MFHRSLVHSKPLVNFSNSRHFSATSKLNVKMSILGAGNPSGNLLALLLKQNPYVSALKLYDDDKNINLKGLTIDLNHIDSPSKVECYSGFLQFKEAISNTDVLIVNNIGPVSYFNSEDEYLDKVCSHIDKMVIQLHHVDKLPIIFIMSDPVHVITPIFYRFLQLEKLFDPKRLIGMSYKQIIANSVLKKLYDNKMVPNIQVYCGSAPGTTYFHQDNFEPLNGESGEAMLTQIEETVDQISSNFKSDEYNLFRASAANRFLTSIAEGFLKRRMVVESAYVHNGSVFANFPCVLGAEGVEQVIYRNEVETPKFYNKFHTHLKELRKYDSIHGLLSSVPINRDGDH